MHKSSHSNINLQRHSCYCSYMRLWTLGFSFIKLSISFLILCCSTGCTIVLLYKLPFKYNLSRLALDPAVLHRACGQLRTQPSYSIQKFRLQKLMYITWKLDVTVDAIVQSIVSRDGRKAENMIYLRAMKSRYLAFLASKTSKDGLKLWGFPSKFNGPPHITA